MTDNSVPEDFKPDCGDCQWHLDNFPREDLYLFEGEAILSGTHINVTREGWARWEKRLEEERG